MRQETQPRATLSRTLRRVQAHAVLGLALCLAAACGSGGGSGAGPRSSDLRIATTDLPDASANIAYSADLMAEGGTGTGLRWRLVGGTIPPGLTVDATGAVTWGAFSNEGTIDTSLEAPRLTEVSGVALSRRNPGVLWVHDDSGSPAEIHALSADGTHLRSYRLNTTQVDWEDIAMGPGPDATKEYLYIGDVGDNGSRRASVALLRVEEPIVTAGATVDIAHERFVLTYPDQAHDCEALVMDWATGAPYLLEKSENGGDVFRVPVPLDAAWTDAAPGTMIAVTTGRPLPASITAADADRSGDRVYFRSYLPLGYQMVRPATGGFDAIFATSPATFSLGFSLQQYEALAVDAPGTHMVTTTEVAIFPSAPVMGADATSTPSSSALRGTASIEGTYGFTLEVRDSAGATATRAFTLTVN